MSVTKEDLGDCSSTQGNIVKKATEAQFQLDLLKELTVRIFILLVCQVVLITIAAPAYTPRFSQKVKVPTLTFRFFGSLPAGLHFQSLSGLVNSVNGVKTYNLQIQQKNKKILS